jgi:hypothetical protein
MTLCSVCGNSSISDSPWIRGVAQFWQVRVGDFGHHDGKFRAVELGHQRTGIRFAQLLQQMRGALQQRVTRLPSFAFVVGREAANTHHADGAGAEFRRRADQMRQLLVEIIAVHQPGHRIDIRFLAHLVGELGLLVQHAFNRTAHGVQRGGNAVQLARPRQFVEYGELAFGDVVGLPFHVVERTQRKPQHNHHHQQRNNRHRQQHPE